MDVQAADGELWVELHDPIDVHQRQHEAPRSALGGRAMANSNKMIRVEAGCDACSFEPSAKYRIDGFLHGLQKHFRRGQMGSV